MSNGRLKVTNCRVEPKSGEKLATAKENIVMSKSDGIEISDKPTWELSMKELCLIFLKRIISLPSKMLGFKPFCLYAATWLLVKGHIRDWIWFCIVVIVLFGIVGLKVVSRWREH